MAKRVFYGAIKFKINAVYDCKTLTNHLQQGIYIIIELVEIIVCQVAQCSESPQAIILFRKQNYSSIFVHEQKFTECNIIV